MILPVLPKTIKHSATLSIDKIVTFGDFYIFLGHKSHEKMDPGTLLVETSFKGRKPGVHWSDKNWRSLSIVSEIQIGLQLIENNKKKLIRIYRYGFPKSSIEKIRDEEHYLEVLLKYG